MAKIKKTGRYKLVITNIICYKLLGYKKYIIYWFLIMK